MKVTPTPPLLSLSITDVADLGRIYIVIEPGAGGIGGCPTLIVQSVSRTWSTGLPDANPIGSLARMGAERLRTALEYSRPTTRADGPHMRDLTHDLAQVIPLAVQQHIHRTQP